MRKGKKIRKNINQSPRKCNIFLHYFLLPPQQQTIQQPTTKIMIQSPPPRTLFI